MSRLGRHTDSSSFHGACCLWLAAACQSWRPSDAWLLSCFRVLHDACSLRLVRRPLQHSQEM